MAALLILSVTVLLVGTYLYRLTLVQHNDIYESHFIALAFFCTRVNGYFATIHTHTYRHTYIHIYTYVHTYIYTARELFTSHLLYVASNVQKYLFYIKNNIIHVFWKF